MVLGKMVSGYLSRAGDSEIKEQMMALWLVFVSCVGEKDRAERFKFAWFGDANQMGDTSWALYLGFDDRKSWCNFLERFLNQSVAEQLRSKVALPM